MFPRFYTGIDLHSNNNTVGVINEQDQVIYRQQLSNVLTVVLQALEPFERTWRGWWWNRPITGTGW